MKASKKPNAAGGELSFFSACSILISFFDPQDGNNILPQNI
jgi:hypothetical protein